MKNTLYDIIVVGGGHAGVEAALAGARLGCTVALCTMDPEMIGYMPCNPSIGGPAKGQIVGEIDALGGEMGRAADVTHIQLKILNRSRGPAVQCLRAQSDKVLYAQHMKQVILSQERITVLTEEIDDLIIEDKTIKGIRSKAGTTIYAAAVVITAGTFLKAIMHTGLEQSAGGRVDEKSSDSLSGSLAAHLKLGRLKTGTPPRLHKDSIDYSKMLIQPGDPEFLRFSFRTEPNDRYLDQLPCYRTETRVPTHEIILNNLDRSPLFTKLIKGKGPRYCPSIEDKIVRFKDKASHHIFIEPESRSLDSIYPQGLNTSLPHDVQDAMLRSMPGLEDVQVLKWGYAVEYDFILPHQLKPTLETRAISGLFFAGQMNGTSGYEEAAGQGLIAGANAGLRVQKRPPLILTREDSFIGTLIDDLIHKDIVEPYRMMTSRSEYRLLFRQDNACQRLSERAFEVGLVSRDDIEKIRETQQEKTKLYAFWKKGRTSDDQVSHFNLPNKIPLIEFAKRSDVTLNDLHITPSSYMEQQAAHQALVEIRYEGYIAKQQDVINKMKAWHNKTLPEFIDFDRIPGLKTESREQLKQRKPKTFYEASRISGINPADLAVLMVYLERKIRV